MPDLGTLTFTIPYWVDGSYSGTTGVSQNYLHDYDSGYYSGTTNGIKPTYPYTGYTTFSYIGIGTSRLSELKKYGATGYTQNLLYSSKTENDISIYFTGYTFTYSGKTGTTTTLQYYDRSDGYTEIAGNTTGFTKEEVFEQALTRNEHFLGFVEQPTVYSDIFVERGKLGVMERNFRLSEIDSMGELSIYGNGYFKVRKQ
jgi:hypothetical protein